MRSGIFRIPISFALFAMVLLCAAQVVGQTADEADAIYERFDQVSRLRGLGDVEGSLEILERIIHEYSDTENIIRRAYNQLVYTLNFAQRPEDARARAREALRRYPDLKVDPAFAPASLDRLYGELRAEMFGSLTIAEPDSCRVFLNGEHVGNTPLHIPLLLADTYLLEMLKSGYDAYQDTLRVNASGTHEFSFSMHRDRTQRWWLTRIGLGAAAGTVAAILLLGEDEPTVEPEPLPGPPATPW